MVLLELAAGGHQEQETVMNLIIDDRHWDGVNRGERCVASTDASRQDCADDVAGHAPSSPYVCRQKHRVVSIHRHCIGGCHPSLRVHPSATQDRACQSSAGMRAGESTAAKSLSCSRAESGLRCDWWIGPPCGEQDVSPRVWKGSRACNASRVDRHRRRRE